MNIEGSSSYIHFKTAVRNSKMLLGSCQRHIEQTAQSSSSYVSVVEAKMVSGKLTLPPGLRFLSLNLVWRQRGKHIQTLAPLSHV